MIPTKTPANLLTEEKTVAKQVSKSDYMLFLRQPAWLWIKKHDPGKLPPVDESLQAIFDAGNAFEAYAEQLFPDGVRLGFNNYDEYLDLPERTKKALEDGAKAIFQGRFEYGQLTFICDIIVAVGDNEVDLYEIKSSTKAKPEHLYDLAFQMIVLEGCGFKVRDIAVLHVNNQFVRNGEIDPKALTGVTNVTELVKAKRATTTKHAAEAVMVAESDIMPNPSPALAKLGSFSDWLQIYRGLTEIEPDSIYDLFTVNAGQIAQLESMSVTKLIDIPAGFVLKSKQTLQLQATRLNKVLMEADKIKEFLDGFEYPLYFLDYETLGSAVPYFDGMKPYCNYPFQYSLHILDAPGAELKHVEYLHMENTNPAEPLIKSLQSHIGNKGSIVTWNMGFEKGCNNTLGELFPEHAEYFEQLNERIVDLMLPFYNGWYVDKGFRGSASIKNVLPVLVPELSYKALGIQDGNSAQRLWMEAVLDGKLGEEKEQILQDLIEYCKLDTLAMVEIHKKLLQVVA